MDRSHALQTSLAPIHTLLVNRYYVDHVYNWIAGGVVLGIAWMADNFDKYVIDGMVNGVGELAVGTGGWLRRAQTGQVQAYAWTLLVGVVALAALALLPLGLARGG
jgi:NADH-quinone oxidoreductase subunit L